MKDVASDFQMIHFSVEHFSACNQISMPEEYPVSFGYFAEIKHGLRYDDPDTRFASIRMGFKVVQGEDITIDQDSEKTYAEITCIAFFICPVEAISADKFLAMLKSAGAATMIPLARAKFATACSLFEAPNSISIPNINVRLIDWYIEKIETQPPNAP